MVTLPAVRRLVSSTLGLSLVASGYSGLAAADPAEPPPVETMQRLPDVGAPAAPAHPTPAPPMPAGPAPATPAPPTTTQRLPERGPPAGSDPPTTMQRRRDEPPPVVATPPTVQLRPGEPRPTPMPGLEAAAGPPTSAPPSWAVRPGDHFWAVAERVLTDAWDRSPTDAEVHRYWRILVEANRSRLRDPANADLLFPGQTLAVPAPPSRPG